MQRKKQKQGGQPSLAPPPPDPRYPEAVLETAPRVAGIDVHKMSLTCTVLVEDDAGAPRSGQSELRGAAAAGRSAAVDAPVRAHAAAGVDAAQHAASDAG